MAIKNYTSGVDVGKFAQKPKGGTHVTERQREIVLGYAECSMNAVETGRKLYLSYVTVGYHLNQIKKSTGIDPRSFYGLCKLVQMAKQIGG